MSSSGPPRRQSDLTVPIDRSQLPPISGRDLSAMGLDPEHPESIDAIDGRKRAITLEACPACASCPICAGAHAVDPHVAAAYRRVCTPQALVVELDEPGDAK